MACLLLAAGAAFGADTPPAATAATIRPIVKSVAERCFEGVRNGLDMNVADFAAQFAVQKQSDEVGHVAGMRTVDSLPIGFLNASSFRHEYYCQLSFGTQDSPAGELRAVMVEVIGALDGLSEKSANHWIVPKHGKLRGVDVSIEIDPRGLILLTIKTLGGHS